MVGRAERLAGNDRDARGFEERFGDVLPGGDLLPPIVRPNRPETLGKT